MPADPSTPSRLPRRLTVPPIGRWHITGKSVLALLIFTIVAAPFLQHSEAGVMTEGVLVTFVLMAGVLAIGGRRRTLITALALAAPAIVARWMNFANPGWAPPEFYLSFGVLAVGYVAWHFLKFVMLARRVDSNVLCSGIAAFLLLALLWAFIYQLVERQVPDSFAFTVGSQHAREMKGMVAVYFSLVTLCTVGFGDIVPTSDIARTCAMLEGVTGVFFVAVVISRLVSLFTIEHQADRPDKPPAK